MGDKRLSDFLHHDGMRPRLRGVVQRLLAHRTEFYTFMTLFTGFKTFLEGLEAFMLAQTRSKKDVLKGEIDWLLQVLIA